jgi:hypothetical protein
MAIPSTAERRFHAVGAAKGSEWGSAVAVGAGNEIKMEDASGLDVPEQAILPALESNTPYVKDSDLGLIAPVDITVPVRMRYEMGAIGSLIAALFGTAGVPVQEGETDAYKHTLQWADDVEDLFFTFVEERVSKIFEAASAKVFRLELNFADGILKANIGLRCNTVVDDSETNTGTETDALTVPSDFYGTTIKFTQASVKMNAESGGNVAEETALNVNDLTVVLERAIEGGVHVAGSETIIEPLEEGVPGPDTKITLSFPRMSTVNNAYFATFQAHTPQKMLIKLEGGEADTGKNYTFALYFPRLVMEKPSYSFEEIIKSGITLQAQEASAAPTGMDYARVYAEIINKQTTDYLA